MEATEIFKGIFVGDAPDDETEPEVEGIFVETKSTEQLTTEHDRMILDLQQTIADVVQGSIAIDEVTRIGCEIESFHELFYLQDKQIKELEDALRKADDFAVGITAFVQSLQAKVIELNARFEDLMAGSGVVTAFEPEVRVRIGHTHTLKDGWRCDSTTIEWTGRGKADWELIRAELGLAHTVGEMEAQRRHTEAVAP